MPTITSTQNLKVNDIFIMNDPKHGEVEGKIMYNTEEGLLAETYNTDIWISKVDPKQIISLRRGKDYFKVKIK